jgi:hypothetical protein
MKKWFVNNKKVLILGFLFGVFVAPFLAVLGIGIRLFEILRPVLIGPMDLIGHLIPDVQIGPNSYYVPAYKWVVTLGFNGICYMVAIFLVYSAVKKLRK